MEEAEAKTEAPAFAYDALRPLSLSDSNRSPSSAHDDSHNYSVFRNEISDLITVDATTPVESDTVDFFSLDVGAAETNENDVVGFVTPAVASKKSRKRKKDKEDAEEEEPRLETTNWFNENSCSKIPMLQLHKGNVVKYIKKEFFY